MLLPYVFVVAPLHLSILNIRWLKRQGTDKLSEISDLIYSDTSKCFQMLQKCKNFSEAKLLNSTCTFLVQGIHLSLG
jgi:hypothetical protein